MEKIKSVLFPTDFSAVADNALRFAIEVVQKTDAVLTIFHAYRIPLPVGNEGGFIVPIADSDYEENAQSQLKELEKSFPRLGNVRYELVSKIGSLNDSIDLLVQEKNAGLIIMGTSGANGLSEVLGTRTSDVIDKLDIPVLVIPEKVVYNGIKKIAFAYDYREMENQGKLGILKMLAELFKSELHILYVAKNETIDSAEDLSSLDSIDQILENMNHQFKVGINPNIEEGISEYVSEKSIDLLVVMPRKHGILDNLFHRSITKKLVYHSHIPLLVLQD